MPFWPTVGQELVVDGLTYHVCEHPAAPDIPYGQEGRAGVVYQLAFSQQTQALKVFKPRFRSPAMVTLADRLRAYSDMPGLKVCQRTVLTPRRHGELLRQHPDLTYSVLMPWISGPTWMQVVMRKLALRAEQCSELARTTLDVLVSMEERGLAHCDISGSNILIPTLADAGSPDASRGKTVELIDLEQMFSCSLERPEAVPGGSPGYAHVSAPAGIWSSQADRFAGAVLVAEMISWCDERIRGAAWGESYFDPQESQRRSERYLLLRQVLSELYGPATAALLERAWFSETLADCPTFAEWLLVLPSTDAASTRVEVATQPSDSRTTRPGWTPDRDELMLAEGSGRKEWMAPLWTGSKRIELGERLCKDEPQRSEVTSGAEAAPNARRTEDSARAASQRLRLLVLAVLSLLSVLVMVWIAVRQIDSASRAKATALATAALATEHARSTLSVLATKGALDTSATLSALKGSAEATELSVANSRTATAEAAGREATAATNSTQMAIAMVATSRALETAAAALAATQTAIAEPTRTAVPSTQPTRRLPTATARVLRWEETIDDTSGSFDARSAQDEWERYVLTGGQHYGNSHYYNKQLGSGQDVASWTFHVPFPGIYEVYAWWWAESYRPADVPYSVQHRNGTTVIRVSQQTEGGRWNLLGRFEFAAGGRVSVSDDASSGRDVVADAIRLVLVQ